ncbi:hypothetical protein [Desulfonatronum parangueonense]
MTRTYPKAHKLSVGYDQKEDRLFLIFHLQNGGFRKAFLSRRMLGALLIRMGAVLSTSHPNAGFTAQRDEVLQMEHVASISVGGGISNADQTPQTQQTKQTQQLPTEFTVVYYVTAAHLEMQQDALVIGFSGDKLNMQQDAPEPIAALALGRSEAHQVLRLLRDKAESACWNVELPAQWMKPLEFGKALEAQ